MKRLPQVTLGLGSLLYASLGVVAIVSPTQFAERAGYEFTQPRGAIEFWALYGGLELGLGLFLLACILRPRWTRAGLAAQGFSLAGIALARLAGLVVRGHVDWVMLVALAIEIGGTVLAVFAFREARYQRYYHLV